MALSDLAVFSEQTYSAMTEVLAQQIDLFNSASRSCIQLVGGANQGDYNELAFFKKISGLVRRRNAYGSGAVGAVKLEHLTDVSVKVAAGTPPVALDPGQFKWIQQSPEVAAAAMGQQLAKDTLADMLNTALLGGYAALSQITDVIFDATAETTKTMIASHLVSGAAKFGDRSDAIVAWIMHSKCLHDFYGAAIANATQLFTYGTVNVVADPFGRVFVVTDATPLITAGQPNVYHTLGLVPGALTVEQNNDFTDNIETSNGDENILRTYQAEWSYNLAVLGFKWDTANGGASPNDAALAVSTNWDRYSTSIKDMAGVVIESN